MGISDHGSIWQTFFYLVAILAVIIIAACVSLIYNAFAISVNERMRQFGLLASIGASKRQLRRSVLLEGGIIAIIGIPIGIAVGLGACAGIFAWLGTSIASILGGQWSSFYLIVDWRVVLFAMGPHGADGARERVDSRLARRTRLSHRRAAPKLDDQAV